MKTTLNPKAKKQPEQSTKYYVRVIGGKAAQIPIAELGTMFEDVCTATDEANRLAEKYPGQSFVVLAKVYQVSFVPKYEKEAITYDCA